MFSIDSFGRDRVPESEDLSKNFRSSYFLGEHLSSPLTGYLLPPIFLAAVGICIARGIGDYFRSRFTRRKK